MSASASTVVIPAAISFSRIDSPNSDTCSIAVEGSAAHRLHLAVDLLPLLLFALDVDLPLQQLRRQPDVLSFFADGK